MKRFRTGRPASQWAGVQTGPMTVDVEALWANRDQNYRYMPAALTPPATQPTAPAEAAPINESTNAPAYTGAAVEAKCTAEVPEESVPKKTGNLLDELPAFKAGMESLEKRGISIFEPERTESKTKLRDAKSKRPKQRSKRMLAARTSGLMRPNERESLKVLAIRLTWQRLPNGQRLQRRLTCPAISAAARFAIIPTAKLSKRRFFNGATSNTSTASSNPRAALPRFTAMPALLNCSSNETLPFDPPSNSSSNNLSASSPVPKVS